MARWVMHVVLVLLNGGIADPEISRLPWLEHAAAPLAHAAHDTVPKNCTAFALESRWAYPSLPGWVEPTMTHVLHSGTKAEPMKSYTIDPELGLPCERFNRMEFFRLAFSLSSLTQKPAGNIELTGSLAKAAMPWLPDSLRSYIPGERLMVPLPLIDRYWLDDERRKVRPGVFIEIGGNDGVTQSNTRILESNFGWSGVMIEANRDYCRQIRHRRREETRVFCPMAVSYGYAVKYLDFSGGSGVRGGLADGRRLAQRLDDGTKPERLIQRKLPNRTLTANVGKSGTKGFSRVEVQPMGALVQQAGIERVDFFSIDVEGAELGILETMDWTIPVHVIFIELDGTSYVKDMACRWLMRSKGFVMVTDFPGGSSRDQVWENPHFEEQVASQGARVGLFPPNVKVA